MGLHFRYANPQADVISIYIGPPTTMRSLQLIFLFFLATAVTRADRRGVFLESTSNAARTFLTGLPNGWLRSTAAFSKGINLQGSKDRTVREVSLAQQIKIDGKAVQQALYSHVGFYYGLTPNRVTRTAETNLASQAPKRLALRDSMSEALDELRTMRREMEALRKELRAIKRQMGGDMEEEEEGPPSPEMLFARREKQQRYDKLGAEVEKWAEEMLFNQDGEADGWTEVHCNRVLRPAFNGGGATRAYLKWMRDSRGTDAHTDDKREYPCIKLYSTLEAPLEQVCAYLSQEQHSTEYNELVERHRDLEEVTPHSKICWGQTPQILFVKPRELITFCHHRWLRDGTQVVVNQACDEYTSEEENLKASAFALRGATYIGRDPDDPEKTRISLLAHASPGNDVPTWACKTAINAIAPIEPFKLIHKINEGIQKNKLELDRNLQDTEMVAVPGRTNRPAGLCQMGYACFWPKGGGVMEGPSIEKSDETPLEGTEDTPINMDSPRVTEVTSPEPVSSTG